MSEAKILLQSPRTDATAPVSDLLSVRVPDFALTPPPERPPSREDFLIAEIQRRFNARRVDSKPSSVIGPPSYESDGEPEWERLGFRGRVGKLLWSRGLEKKAIRFVSCNKQARPGLCSRYPDEHKFFIPNGCEVIFCKECAQESRRELFQDYLNVILETLLLGPGLVRLILLIRRRFGLGAKPKEPAPAYVREAWSKFMGSLRDWKREAGPVIPPGWVLARINFTLRSDGSEITPDRVKKLNAAVGAVMQETIGDKLGYGMLFNDEVGFESRGHLPDDHRVAHGLNLHCHGLYFGPRVDWERTRDLWMAATEKAFGVSSLGFYISAVKGFKQNPEHAVRWALSHMLKYLSKPPAVSSERLAGLITAFDGTRRVHALGLFSGRKSEPSLEKKSCACPKCRVMGIPSTVEFQVLRVLPSGGCVPLLVPVEDLLKMGYESLRGAGGAGRAAIFSMHEGRGGPP